MFRQGMRTIIALTTSRISEWFKIRHLGTTVALSAACRSTFYSLRSLNQQLVEVRSRWMNSYWFRSQDWVVSNVRELDLDSQPFLEIPQACRILLENSFDNLFDVRSPSVEEGMSLRAVFPRFLYDRVQDLLE